MSLFSTFMRTILLLIFFMGKLAGKLFCLRKCEYVSILSLILKAIGLSCLFYLKHIEHVILMSLMVLDETFILIPLDFLFSVLCVQGFLFIFAGPCCTHAVNLI